LALCFIHPGGPVVELLKRRGSPFFVGIHARMFMYTKTGVIIKLLATRGKLVNALDV
jgi:hypothetical protein